MFPQGEAKMGSSPTMNAAVRGVVMQGVMVLAGMLVPALGQMPNFYAIAGTVLAALTGTLVSRRSPGAAAGQVATGGAIAGASSSVIGGLFAVVSGQWPGFEALQLLFPAISGGVAGGLGGVLGRLMRPAAIAR
jgi:hypothetical protein